MSNWRICTALCVTVVLCGCVALEGEDNTTTHAQREASSLREADCSRGDVAEYTTRLGVIQSERVAAFDESVHRVAPFRVEEFEGCVAEEVFAPSSDQWIDTYNAQKQLAERRDRSGMFRIEYQYHTNGTLKSWHMYWTKLDEEVSWRYDADGRVTEATLGSMCSVALPQIGLGGVVLERIQTDDSGRVRSGQARAGDGAVLSMEPVYKNDRLSGFTLRNERGRVVHWQQYKYTANHTLISIDRAWPTRSSFEVFQDLCLPPQGGDLPDGCDPDTPVDTPCLLGVYETRESSCFAANRVDPDTPPDSYEPYSASRVRLPPHTAQDIVRDEIRIPEMVFDDSGELFGVPYEETFDGEGRLVERRHEFGVGSDPFEPIVRTVVYEYYPNGELRSWVFTHENDFFSGEYHDGDLVSPDSTLVIGATYMVSGTMQNWTYTLDRIGRFMDREFAKTASFFSTGDLEQWFVRDGGESRLVTESFDDRGRMTVREVDDQNSVGVEEWSEVYWEYDDFGRLASVEYHVCELLDPGFPEDDEIEKVTLVYAQDP